MKVKIEQVVSLYDVVETVDFAYNAFAYDEKEFYLAYGKKVAHRRSSVNSFNAQDIFQAIQNQEVILFKLKLDNNISGALAYHFINNQIIFLSSDKNNFKRDVIFILFKYLFMFLTDNQVIHDEFIKVNSPLFMKDYYQKLGFTEASKIISDGKSGFNYIKLIYRFDQFGSQNI